ncbi:hypothetical protein B6E66_23605 [Streptomyces maremycinicus]|nr:hypothetical protein B6E66_23605 [Streptomyces sp. B9173]
MVDEKSELAELWDETQPLTVVAMRKAGRASVDSKAGAAQHLVLTRLVRGSGCLQHPGGADALAGKPVPLQPALSHSALL